MVMIVKDHEKQSHGFISVTRVPIGTPADLKHGGTFASPHR